MGARSCLTWSLAALAASFALLGSAASAQECESDTDCADGALCRPRLECHGASGDADSGGMAGGAGAPGADPGSGAGGSGAGDDGAPDGEVPPEDEPEPEPEPEADCEEIFECVPRYLLPCEQADDCGDGFTCERYQECDGGTSMVDSGAGSAGGASGGAGGSGSGDPGAGGASGSGEMMTPEMGDELPPEGQEVPAMPEPRQEPMCMESSVGYCRPIEIECESDDDCLDGFVCGDSQDAPSMGADPGVSGSAGGGAPGSGAGGSGADGSGAGGSMGSDPGATPTPDEMAGDMGEERGDVPEPEEEEEPTGPEPQPEPEVNDVAGVRYCTPLFGAPTAGGGTSNPNGDDGNVAGERDFATGGAAGEGSMDADQGSEEEGMEEVPAICSVATLGARRDAGAAGFALLSLASALLIRKRRAHGAR